MTRTEKFRDLLCCALLGMVCVAALASCQQAKHPSANKQGAAKPDNTLLFRKYNLDKIVLPDGFAIAVFAEVPNARSLTLGSKGTVFVSNRNEDNVYAVEDIDKDGIADTVYTIASRLNTPNGVAFKDGSLYVAEINRILRFDNIEDNLAKPPAYKVVYDKLPTKTHHGWKFLAMGPDGKLYFNVGAPCNVCDEKDSIFATIARINTDGSGLEVFAKGVRNSVGFDWHPETHELWFTDNGRDDLGDNIPYCELNHAPTKGLHFGFPYIHQGDIADPTFGKGKKPADYVKPALKVGPHAAPLGMRFYTGNMFPENYKHAIFIAEHGSWNRSVPYGYQVKTAFLQGDTIVAYKDFATGWLQNNKKVLGRPVDVLQMPDGALLISDDMNGVIYRVAYNKSK
jgi:glucose/arabinose dehydrogenase